MDKKRVLIVDDEADFVETASQRLSFEGFEIAEALDGETALALIQKGAIPDIILLDIMMPGMNGIDVFSKLRSDPRTADVPIIFLTVWEHLIPGAALRSKTPCATLRKPFDFDDLIKLMRDMLEGRKVSEG
ncbi:MAG: response regulator [bacterium]